MDKFMELFQSSAVIQGGVALVVVGAVAYQAITRQPSNETLNAMATLILGYYFGTKTSQAVNAIRSEAKKAVGGHDGS